MVAVLLFLLVLLAARHLGTGSVRTEGASGLHLPTRAVLPLAGLIVLIAFVEGGLTDWGGVYLDQGVGAERVARGPGLRGVLAGSLRGSHRRRLGQGPHRLDPRSPSWGMFLAAASIAVFLLARSDPCVALAGMVAAGIGIANTVPQIFGAAGRIPPGGPSLSAVFTTLTLAFMAGPAIIGTTSDLIGISGAFWLFVVASVVVALIVPRVPTAETNPQVPNERLMGYDERIELGDGRRLWYLDEGESHAVPVVFCHGSPSSRLAAVDHVHRVVDRGGRIIAPDRPGLGHSDPEPGRSLASWAGDVADLMNVLGIARFRVLAVSGGGPYALALAWALPDRVERVALLSSPGSFDIPGAMDGMARAHRTTWRLAALAAAPARAGCSAASWSRWSATRSASCRRWSRLDARR